MTLAQPLATLSFCYRSTTTYPTLLFRSYRVSFVINSLLTLSIFHLSLLSLLLELENSTLWENTVCVVDCHSSWEHNVHTHSSWEYNLSTHSSWEYSTKLPHFWEYSITAAASEHIIHAAIVHHLESYVNRIIDEASWVWRPSRFEKPAGSS